MSFDKITLGKWWIELAFPRLLKHTNQGGCKYSTFNNSNEMHQIPQEHMLMRKEQQAMLISEYQMSGAQNSYLQSLGLWPSPHECIINRCSSRLSCGKDKQRSCSPSPQHRHLDLQFKEEEVFLFGLEYIHQLEDIGMLHPEEKCRKAKDRQKMKSWVIQCTSSDGRRTFTSAVTSTC